MKDPNVDFTSKETYYYKMLDKYFSSLPKESIELMLDIIEGRSYISLRIMDWLVTKHANKHKVRYKVDKNDDEDFNIHISYKAQLKSYKKKYFDPFRRRKKFDYYYDKDDDTKFIETTLGQLNFFRWAFTFKIIQYIEAHYQPLSKAMNSSNKEDKERKEEKKVKKVKELEKKKKKDKDKDKDKDKKGSNKSSKSKDKDIKITTKKKVSKEYTDIYVSFD